LRNKDLCLDLVLAAEHVVHLGQVVNTGADGLDVSSRLEVLLQVSVLTELAHSIIGSGLKDSAGVETVLEVKLLNHLGDIANNLSAEHGAGKAGTVGEQTDALGLLGVEGDVAKQASKTTVDGSSVHVTTLGGDLETGVDTLSEALLGQTHEGLLNDLVRERLLVVEIAKLGGNLGEGGVGGVGQEVVVEHAGERLLDKLASRSMEKDVVEAVERGLGLIGDTIGAVGLSLEGLFASIVGLVAGIDSLGVALEGVVAVDNGVLAGQVGLVEVVGVGEVGGTETGIEDNRGIRSNDHSNATSTAGGTGSTSGVQGNITGDDDGITTIPGGGLNPVDAVEHGVGTAVAGVDVVDTLDVGVSVGSEQLHEDGLDGLGLIQKGLSADLESANGLRVDVVLVHEGGEGGQGHGVDVY
jgi:hypothetical protein